MHSNGNSKSIKVASARYSVRAAIYTRVSSQRQVDEGHSLGAQLAACEKFVAEKGWTLAGSFEDAGISGGKSSRPELDRMASAVKHGEVDVLISPWIDRIGRSAANTAALFELFDGAGVALWTPDGKRHDGDSAAAKLMRNALAMAAQFERDMIRERVTASNPGKAARGSYHGGPVPFGYELGEKGGLVVCESEAKWIRYMFKRYADDGASGYRIATELEAAEVKSSRGGQWSGKSILDRLRSPIYAGKVREGQPGKHEAIIDAETFQKAQTRLAATRAEDKGGRGRRASTHLLDHGMLKCGCGASMKPVTYQTGTPVYKCSRGTHGEAKCGQTPVPQTTLDHAMLTYLSEHVISPGLTANELAADQERAQAEAKGAKSAADRQRKQAEQRHESAKDKWLDGKINDEEWARLQARFEGEIAGAAADLAAAEATLTALASPDPESMAAVERLRADIAGIAEHGSVQDYGGLLRRLYERVELVAGAEVTGGEAIAADDVIAFEHGGRVYGLVPILRTELAAIYGSDPLVGVASQIGSKGKPLAATVEVVVLAMAPP
jgi:site-specific DNA recombinase